MGICAAENFPGKIVIFCEKSILTEKEKCDILKRKIN